MSEITIPKEAWNEAKAVVERYRNLVNPNLEDMACAACLAMLKAWRSWRGR